MESTVITHLSNVRNIVPPTPTPHPNWLYFNGEFNTNLMPSGFTNFNDKLLTFTGDTGTLNYQINYQSLNFLKPYLTEPNIIQFQGFHANSWELTNGILKRVQTGEIPLDGDTYNDYHCALFIPISIQNNQFSKAYIEYEWVGEKLVDKYEETVDFWIRANDPYGALAARGYKRKGDSTPGVYIQELTILPLAHYHVAYRYYQFEPFLVTREIQIKEIWFE
ncbi:MAG TPA: hypothetical protein P5513_03365 [Candidatus Diapherotrites archaeon]|nr:hypothetical protein [Candidatus Diapherotrites archaeon]